MQCVHCATPVPDDAVYCHQCGSLVSDAEGQAAITASMDDSAIRHLTDLLREDTQGDYEIIKQLGRGGMAVVFLAKEIELHRQVAIKALPPELTFGHGVERFKREARTAAGLDHANIIPIYRIAGGGRIFWYAMKYLEGRSLDHVVKDMNNMSLKEVIELLQPVADALDYAHEQQVIHRDIKPANIMVDPRNRVVVTDFGIAKALTESTLTASGSVIGTPYYMSPEQGMGHAVSGASDQYSVAVMAYRMLSGQLPFEGGSAIDILHKHCTMPPPPLTVLRPNLPDHVYATVHKALSKKPEGRFSSVTAFVKGLQERSPEISDEDAETLTAGGQLPDMDRLSTELIVTPSPTPQPGTPTGPASGFRRLLYPLVGVLIVAAVGVGAWQMGQSSARPVPANPVDSVQTSETENTEGGPAELAEGSAAVESLGTGAEPAETTVAQPPAPQMAQLSVTGAPAGAIIRIDGAQQRGTDFELQAGRHTISVNAPGYRPFNEDVTLVAGEAYQIPYVAVPEIVAAAPQRLEPTPQEEQTRVEDLPPGTLLIGVLPVAAILFVDAEERDSGRRHTVELPPGEHELRFVAEGFVTKDTTVIVVSGVSSTVRIELTRSS